MTNKTLLMLLLALAVGIALGGSLQLRYEVLGRNEIAKQAIDAHAGHDHSEGASQVTVWTEQFEIFLEYPPIMVGTPTAFVTHVSNLKTGEPRTTGPATFVLSQGSSRAEHIDPAPARAGIYIPELTFPLAGQWNVSLVVPYNGRDNVIVLPPVQVYASDDEIHNAPAPEQIEGLSFLKEQQWKLKTETKVVGLRQIAGVQAAAIPQSAVIEEGDEHIAFVQLAGETFSERVLTLGSKADGFVQVLSGVSQGDRVVTKGAEAVDETAHSDAAHEDEQAVLSLTEDEIERYGIALAAAGPGNLDVHVSLPGQIVINTDRMAHIVPNSAGVVRQVISNVGDKVKAGDVLAWIESPELGKAKVDYLTKWAELGCCAMDLTRTQQIHQSTTKLLETLQANPALETISQITGTALGKNHTTLVSAYAELSLAKAAYLREKPLFEKEISSEQDFLAAENEFKKAEAKYAAARDSIEFEIKKTLIDAERDQQVRQIGVKGAERTLYVLGLKADDVNDVRLLAKGLTPSIEKELCTDPNCTECKKSFSPRGDKEKLAWYPLRAPFDGTVIEKHITLGEKLTGESDAYTVADINSVWVDLNVHQKGLPLIAIGQRVQIGAGPATGKTEGRISYVSPVVGESSRTTLARIVLENKFGLLRPGTFVTAEVVVDQVLAKVAVPKDIIQDVADSKTVFVRTDHGFEARPVKLGKSNTELVEITSGLEPGEIIVTKNSFRLKAELKKDVGGGHAGHSH